MPYLNPEVQNKGLEWAAVTNGESIWICSSDPGTYAAANTARLGSKAAPTLAIANKSGGGREINLTAFTNGSVTAGGTATHWALVNSISEVLVAAGPLSASQSVSNGNQFGLSGVALIGIPGLA
jgi:hypothetical protein